MIAPNRHWHTFIESDLQFDFKIEDWELIKYDAHRYYKILSGAGLKGVDFLGIYKGQQVVFFEIKNYHNNLSKGPHQYSIFENRALVVKRIAGKMEDSAQAIRIIIQYLKRKWWYRFFLKWENSFPSSLIKKRDWYFWHVVSQLLQQGKIPMFVLWLEIDPKTKVFSSQKINKLIQQELSELLSEFTTSVMVANRKYPVFTASLKVGKYTVK